MESSTPCTPSNDAINALKESETINEMRTSTAPISANNSSSFLNEAPSPLGHLDPHRLRDMVVDKQANCPTQLESPYKQPYWTPSPAGLSSSPSSNIRSVPTNSSPPVTPIMQPPKLPGPVRDPALLSPSGTCTPVQQQSLGMCLSACSPMGSPSGVHPPPSPFLGRPSSNASASPYMQPPQTPLHYQTNIQSPAGSIPPGHVPSSSPCATYSSRMPGVGSSQSQQYSCHPQIQQSQWTGQQPQPLQHFTAQPQMVAPSGPVQRVLVQRVPYPGYPPGMPQVQSQTSSQPPPSPTIYPNASGASVTPSPRVAMYPPAAHSPGPSSAQYPQSSYYQTKGHQHPSYPSQPPVYRQQPSQTMSVRTYLGNQLSPMSVSSVYPVTTGTK